MEPPVLQTHGLVKRFGPVAAVNGVDLQVQPGEVFGFLGPNGAGKTTTIGMILGLLYPTSGRVALFGEDVTPAHTAPLRKVGALVGEPGMVPHLSGRANLRLLARLHPGVTYERIEAVLEQVGLAHAAGRAFRGYSTGMKQRLGIGAALLHQPRLLILDEPTNGLDPAGMREIRELLRELAGQGVTVFLSSHLLHEIEQVCDRVAVLNQGRVVAHGPVAALLGTQRVVRARVPEPEAAARLLAELHPASVRTNGGTVEVEGVASEAVITRLVAGGMVPSEVTNGHAALEDIFLELTEGGR
jgi:ABC-2 type transport system ATP-binding protein